MLVASDPGSIETIDETVIGLARGDVIWHQVRDLVAETAPSARASTWSSSAATTSWWRARWASCSASSAPRGRDRGPHGYTVTSQAAERVASGRCARKASACSATPRASAGRCPSWRTPRCRPERLADYIREFRAILDGHGLRYGMFGHVDVGCLHVRPALNLRDPEDGRLLRQISDEVTRLVKSYGGVLWAEHGKGFRSEYSPTFFGPELYRSCARVKGAFDPYNQLNPGKLATPPDQRSSVSPAWTPASAAISIGRSARAPALDSTWPCTATATGSASTTSPDHVMCPSSKVTRDRIHSPKGRASILREWLRLMSNAGHEPGKRRRHGNGRAPRSAARGSRGLLTRGLRRHERLPRVQGVRHAVPDQGGRSGAARASFSRNTTRATAVRSRTTSWRRSSSCWCSWGARRACSTGSSSALVRSRARALDRHRRFAEAERAAPERSAARARRSGVRHEGLEGPRP